MGKWADQIERYQIRATGLLLAGFLLGGAIGWKGPFSQETAAWVQAIGSIAAIAGAFKVARDQFDRERQHAAERDAFQAGREAVRIRRMTLEAVIIIDLTVDRVLHGIRNADVGLASITMLSEDVELKIETLGGLPVWTLPKPGIMADYLSIIGIAKAVRTNLEAVRSSMIGSPNPGYKTQPLEAQLKVCRQNILHLKTAIGPLQTSIIHSFDRAD